ncbi:penicillin-binding protein 1A [Brackiella oedipodis]|uniref:penicillin-binding protein 1A n=1 Tax=Brackiella oedipodis TaxID=124225 RepID=UPI00056DB5AE|nr:PBP1A family penicillin-binding protein [Brackiella oedipodis]
MSETKKASTNSPVSWLGRFLLKTIFFCVGIGICGLICLVLAVSLVWPNLPDLKVMTDYRPRVPLRIYSADNLLLSEYGEERRNVLRIDEFPDVLKKAMIAAEDDRFYQHGGVDWSGVGRAVLANLVSGAKAQGASTITMQVARNFYLSSEKSFVRKFYELLLTYKIEQNLTKDQILELYLNQIYLGHHSYGFSTAARTYFGKPLSDIDLAEAAILAGIPKSPSINNPRSNLKRAKRRQEYVLGRMLSLGFINQAQHDQALNEEIKVRKRADPMDQDEEKQYATHGQYVSELARQLMYNVYKDNVYARGLNVYTTVNSKDQRYAYNAVREGVLAYTRRKVYPGPAGHVDLPAGVEQDPDQIAEILDKAHNEFPDSDSIIGAVVLSASANKVVVMRDPEQVYEISGDGLNVARRALNPKAPASRQIKRGSVVYLERFKAKEANQWRIVNLPTVEGAFVAMHSQDGAIQSMIGGFDFKRGDFNRVTQAWRQPGSTFKPFVYAAALERGLTPETNVSDQPFVLSAKQTGGKPWTPKNYGGRFTASQTLRRGLYQSRNMISIRVLQAAGADFAQDFVARFGFDKKNQPSKRAYLTMALGAGNVTMLQMATGYAAFANGGYLVDPYIIDHVTDNNGKVLMQAHPAKAGDEKNRIIDPRTAYLMNELLHGVATSGTAARITGTLKRSDLHGKTGTTNQSFDAWFAGYTPSLVGISWMGFDHPASLGDRETGGGVAMPIWISYMQKALKGVPVAKVPAMPKGLSKVDGNYYYDEFPKGKAIMNVGVKPSEPSFTVPTAPSYQPQNDPVNKAIDNFNPLGGPPIRF